MKIKKKKTFKVHPRFPSNGWCSQCKINLTLEFFGLHMASETVVHIHTFMFYHMYTVCNSVVLKYFIGFPLYLKFWWVSLKNLHAKKSKCEWFIHFEYMKVFWGGFTLTWSTLFSAEAVLCISVQLTAGCWGCINIVSLYLLHPMFTFTSYLYVLDCPEFLVLVNGGQ